jgi:hypothetical protein
VTAEFTFDLERNSIVAFAEFFDLDTMSQRRSVGLGQFLSLELEPANLADILGPLLRMGKEQMCSEIPFRK